MDSNSPPANVTANRPRSSQQVHINPAIPLTSYYSVDPPQTNNGPPAFPKSPELQPDLPIARITGRFHTTPLNHTRLHDATRDVSLQPQPSAALVQNVATPIAPTVAPTKSRKRPAEVICLLSDDENVPLARKARKLSKPGGVRLPFSEALQAIRNMNHNSDGPMSFSDYAAMGTPTGSSPPGSSQPYPTPREDRKVSLQEFPAPMSSPPLAPPSSSATASTPHTKPTAPKAPRNAPALCQEQEDLVNLIMSGCNVFYTGSAGCGKSTVLKAFVKRLEEVGKKVNIVAPTGRAALDINGSTTWTYAGWTPLHHKKPLHILKQGAHQKFVHKRINATDVLVIDEISMVENHHLERINEFMKEARGSNDAFGGVQMVITGDFCQLPPVKPFEYCMTCGKQMRRKNVGTVYYCPTNAHGEFPDEDKWAFRSKAWEAAEFVHVQLTNIHRQKDATFISILQKCRIGIRLDENDIKKLVEHKSNVENAVRLFSTVAEVRSLNQIEFNKLQSQKRSFTCYDDFQWNREHRNLEWKNERFNPGNNSLKALADHKFQPVLELKEGMLVILLINLDIANGLVNGSQGIITGFDSYNPSAAPKSANSLKEKRKKGEEGPLTHPMGGQVLSGDHQEHREQRIKWFMEIDQNKDKVWPIVKFDNGVTRTIYADCTVNELGDEQPYSLLSRTQIPLTAAWAMSIHKSQGMTLAKVVVDLSKSFEDGQMYVGLSRAKSLMGLKVEGLKAGLERGRMTNETVKKFLWEKFNVGQPIS